MLSIFFVTSRILHSEVNTLFLAGMTKTCTTSLLPVLWHPYVHSCVTRYAKTKRPIYPTHNGVLPIPKFQHWNEEAVCCCVVQEPVWTGAAPRGAQIETSSCRDPQSNTKIPWRVRRIFLKKLKWLWKLHIHTCWTHLQKWKSVFLWDGFFKCSRFLVFNASKWQDWEKQSA